MPLNNRREFLRASAAAAGVVGLSTASVSHGSAPTNARIAVVARGRAGERMAKLFLSHVDATVAAVAGVRVRNKSLRTSGNWKTTATRWLADPTVSALAVSVPGSWPLHFAFAALECGKDVYLDPLRGYASTDLIELEAAARANGRVVYVALPHRVNPGLREAVDAVRNGAVGVVKSVRAICLRGPNDTADPFGSAAWSSRAVKATDLAIWTLGDAIPTRVFVAGFTTRRLPAAAIPESAVAAFTHGSIVLTLEQSAITAPLPDGVATGAIVEGTSGRLICRDTEAVLLTPDGAVAKRFTGSPDPVGAFLRAVANRNVAVPAWSGLAAIQSAAVAYRDAEAVAVLPQPVAASFSSLVDRASSAGLTPFDLRVGTSAVS